MKFIGRSTELNVLNRLRSKSSSSIAVIWGRRRIGKSRLIREFSEGKKTWSLVGLPPSPGVTNQSQLDVFASQMSKEIGMPKIKATDWGELFWHLGNQAAKEKELIIVLDEISWMGSKDPNFLGQLKTLWDQSLSKKSGLILILCGSISSWIEKNILSSTGFLGRISAKIEVKELPLTDCNSFWGRSRSRISSYEKLKFLSVSGGVPKYLEEMLPSESADTNIHNLCFSPEGFLFNEYDHIFSDLFDRRALTFDKIVRSLSNGPKILSEICRDLGIEKSGNVSAYLHELILAGFVEEDCIWSIRDRKSSSLKKFRLKDNYLRFYLKYIHPNKKKIEHGKFAIRRLESLPEWQVIAGLQFENLVLNNKRKVCEILGLDEYEMAGPYFQNQTKVRKGCQIDLLIQTRFNTLYVCEIKFHRGEVTRRTLQEMDEKISRLQIPKSFSIRPVLIHVNGLTEDVDNSDYFDHVIDFGSLLEESSSR